MRELVQRMFEIPPRTRLGALTGECEVFVAGKNLQLINARLAATAAGNCKADEPCLLGGERFDIVFGCHRRAFSLAGRSDELGQLRFQFPNTLLHGGGLGLGGVVERQIAVGVFHAFEDALECVIILLRNGIELVIVTTRATGGEP